MLISSVQSTSCTHNYHNFYSRQQNKDFKKSQNVHMPSPLHLPPPLHPPKKRGGGKWGGECPRLLSNMHDSDLQRIKLLSHCGNGELTGVWLLTASPSSGSNPSSWRKVSESESWSVRALFLVTHSQLGRVTQQHSSPAHRLTKAYLTSNPNLLVYIY